MSQNHTWKPIQLARSHACIEPAPPYTRPTINSASPHGARHTGLTRHTWKAGRQAMAHAQPLARLYSSSEMMRVLGGSGAGRHVVPSSFCGTQQ